MKIVEPSASLIWVTPAPELNIEIAGKTCYKSEPKVFKDCEHCFGTGKIQAKPYNGKFTIPEHYCDYCSQRSTQEFIRMVINRGHESVLEHAAASFRIVCDRGISHEIVRHRIASYSQESTRYVSSVDKKLEILNEDDVEYYYETGLSMKRLSILSNGRYSENNIYRILEARNTKRRPLGNTGNIFSDYFEKIDTPEKAYLLGLIQADGSLNKNSNSVTITQNKKYSWYIWKMICLFIRPNAKRVNDKNCHGINFCSDKLYSDLKLKGIIPNKSNVQTENDIELLWRSIPKKFIPSFLRGFLDGDGSIRYFKQKNKAETISCNISWNGNKHLLLKIQEWLEIEFNYKSNILKHTQTDKLFRVSITTPDIGDKVIQKLLENFIFPFGHPSKTSRMIERVGGQYPIYTWGDEKFQIIKPNTIPIDESIWVWLEAMDNSEISYKQMIMQGISPQNARSVLNNSIKTELVMTTNFRSWKNFLKLRLDKAAHPDMIVIAKMVCRELKKIAPTVFEEFECEK